jgi:hypothetical protein
LFAQSRGAFGAAWRVALDQVGRDEKKLVALDRREVRPLAPVIYSLGTRLACAAEQLSNAVLHVLILRTLVRY